jgi:alpha-1,3-mannosyl-glycoprotein beta-1,2-N-acetylglucosaminyltransferase
MYTSRARNPVSRSSTRHCATLLLGVSICAVGLLGLGHWAVWTRRACDLRVAAAASAAGAADRIIGSGGTVVAPVAGDVAALDAEVRRLKAQVAYLTGDANGARSGAESAGGGRVFHAPPGGGDVVVRKEKGDDPLAPPQSGGNAVSAKAQALESAPKLAVGARALLVICYNRPDYLRRTLDAVRTRLPAHNRPHIFISQDGSDAGVSSVISDASAAFARDAPDVPVTTLRHPNGNLRGRDIPSWATSYYALAQHFGWALTKIFDLGYARAIILEDDIEIAIDFFDFLTAMEPIADSDPRVLAVSAYNDLGQPNLVSDARQVYRSDFFPGLGWMIGRHAWEELGPKWPDGFWDDWLREPAQRKGRHFLRPEVSRTLTFGEKGVSGGQFSTFLSSIQLNEQAIDWAQEDTSYLSEPVWDASMSDALSKARAAESLDAFVAAECEASAPSTAAATAPSRSVSWPYTNHEEFRGIARRFGFLDDEKAGVPRTAYKGVVTFKHQGCRKLVHQV